MSLARRAAVLSMLVAPAAVNLAPSPALGQAKGPAIVVPPNTPPDVKAKVAELRAKAVGDDRAASTKAFEELKAMGDVGKPTLLEALRLVLNRDRDAVDTAAKLAAAAGDLGKLEADVDAQRKQALGVAEKVADAAAVKVARANYEKLKGSVRKLNDAYAARGTVLDLMRVRPPLVAMWLEVAPKSGAIHVGQAADPAGEQKLNQSAQAALGPKLMPILETMRAAAASPDDPAPAGAEQAGFLGYRMRKRVDAYNRATAISAPGGQACDLPEYELIRWINGYRDMLGLPLLEMDPRLQQAARRHSKEMVELKFFGPTSPTPENKDAMLRYKAAGMEPPAAWAEALSKSTNTPQQTFWFLFEAPPYHQAMVSANAVLIGAGKWNATWTVEFASGNRTMLASEAQRAAIQPQGNFLMPQTLATASAGGQPAGDDRITDPRQIKPRGTGGGVSVPIPSLPAIPGL
ncbi:MAG TPA: CAP domain-containing protein [Humisphaera sp.]